jgi:hypothetical protein
MKLFGCVIAAAVALGLASCTTRTGDLTLTATKNISSLKNAQKLGRFEGKDCKTFTPPNLEEAIDRAIEEGDGNALVDAVLYWEPSVFRACFRAKGTVVKLKE